jgi:hypothetical protein
MPIDPFPIDTGDIVLDAPGRVERIAGACVAPEKHWQTQFASCPNADSHRTSRPRRRRPAR